MTVIETRELGDSGLKVLARARKVCIKVILFSPKLNFHLNRHNRAPIFLSLKGGAPAPMALGDWTLRAGTVPDPEFMLFTKIPIVIYYGDNIPDKPSVNPGQEQ